MSGTDTSVGRRHAPHASAPVVALDRQFDLAGLGALREAVAGCAHRLGLGDRQAGHLIMVAGELAANAVAHGGGTGTLRLWRSGSRVYCEAVDRGPGIADKGVGQAPPEPMAIHGRGLWMCRQVCALTIEDVRGGGCRVTAVIDTSHARRPAHR